MIKINLLPRWDVTFWVQVSASERKTVKYYNVPAKDGASAASKLYSSVEINGRKWLSVEAVRCES
jgi:hypothetical protein